MPNPTRRRLLMDVYFGLPEVKRQIEGILAELDKLHERAKRNASELTSLQDKRAAQTKQEILDERLLQEEAKKLGAINEANAKLALKKQQTLKAQREQQLLETTEIKKQQVLQEGGVRLQAQQLRLQQQLAKEAERQQALVEKQSKEREAQLLREKKLQDEIIEKERRAQAQAKVQGVITQAAAAGPQVLTAAQIAQRKEILVEEKQRVAILESQLRLLSTQAGVKKEDLAIAQQQLAQERAKLLVEEAQLRQSEELLRKQLQQERLAEIAREQNARALAQTRVQAFTAQATTAPLILNAAQIAQRKEILAEERMKLGIYEQQIKLLAAQEGIKREDLVIVQKQIGEERAKLALQASQLQQAEALLMKRRESNILLRMREGAGAGVRNILGGGLFSQVATGAFTGFIGAEIFTNLIENIHKLGEAILEETGKSRQMRLEFQRLAEMKGIVPEEMIGGLTKATRGLIEDTELFRIANNFLRSGMKVSNEEITRLISNTVNLGRSMAKSMPEVQNALERAFLNPQRGMMMLARVTGINVNELRRAVAGLPQSMDTATRSTIMFNHILAEEEKMLKKVGVPVLTLPELLRQARIAQKDFIDDMAQGITGTGNFQAALEKISKWLIDNRERIAGWARTIGKDIGAAGKFVIDHLKEIKITFEALLALKLYSWVIGTRSVFEGLGKTIGWVTNQTKALIVAEQEEMAVRQAAALGRIGTGATGIAAPVAGGVTLATAGIAAAAVAGTVGMIAAGMKAANLSISDAIIGIKELEREIKEGLAGAWAAVKENGFSAWRGLKTVAEPILDWMQEQIPLLGDLWDKFGVRGKKAWKDIGDAAKAGILGALPAGISVPVLALKELSEKGKQRQVMVEGVEEAREKALAPPKLAYEKTYSPHVKTEEELAAEQETYAAKRKRLQQEMQIEQLMAKIRLEDAKMEADKELTIVKRQYDNSIISLEEYAAKEKTIKQTLYEATIKDIQQERAAQFRMTEQLETYTIDGVTFQVTKADQQARAKEIISLKYRQREKAAELAHQKEMDAIDNQILADKEAAYRHSITQLTKIAKEGVTERIHALEEEFQGGRVSADDYIAQKKALIEEEYSVTVEGLNKQLEAAKDNEAERNTINVEIIQAEIDREKKLSEVIVKENDIRLKSLENHYNLAKKFLETSLKTTQLKVGPEAAREELAIQHELLSITQQYIAELENKASLEQEGSKNWITIQEQIAQAVDEEQQLNNQLRQAQLVGEALSGVFGEISGLLENLRSTTLRDISQLLRNMAQSAQQIAQFQRAAQMAGGGVNYFKQIGQSITGLFHKTPLPEVKKTAQQIFDEGLSKSARQLTDTTATTRQFDEVIKQDIETIKAHAEALKADIQSMTGEGEGEPKAPTNEYGIPGTLPASAGVKKDSFTSFLDKLSGAGASVEQSGKKASSGFEMFSAKLVGVIGGMQAAAAGISGLIKGITSGRNAVQGAFSGASAGMQYGAAFGPIGALVGAVGGGVLGGLFGYKEKQLRRDIHTIQMQMQSIVDSMTAGTISMGQAIQDMRRERLAAIQLLSQNPKSGKGGGKGKKGDYNPSQAQSIINEIDAKIGELVNEQKMLLGQLDEQLAVLSQPQAFQQYAQSLDTIIQKYQQFASAAQGDAQAVGNAQLFLNESLKQYVQTLSVQLNEAQQQAIQDALQLLDLEYQRQQIINQEAQQEYDILTQGVLVRQRTTAMTKGQEIGQLRYQRDMQLRQIDEQIALQQYKVQTEQKIFGLATTRIGLETQLLSLQEEQAGYQAQQVAALSQVVQQLQQGMASGGLMNQITSLYAGGALPTGTSILTTILGQLGLGGNIPQSILTGTGGATNYLAQIPQPYQGIANFINNIDPSFLINLWKAMQTPAGSAQRQAAVSEAAPYQKDASTSGYDFSGFVSWIKKGPPIQASTATVTNAPVSTAPLPMPAGTSFGMPVTVGYAPSTIPPSPGTGGLTPFEAVSGQLQGSSLELTDFNSNVRVASNALAQLAANAKAITTGFKSGYTGASTASGGTGVTNYVAPVVSSPIVFSPTMSYSTRTATPVMSGMYPIPSYDVGGPIEQDELAMVHAGEYVLTKPIVNVLNTIGGVPKVIAGTLKSLGGNKQATPVMGGVFNINNVNNNKDILHSNVRLAVEQHLTNLTSTRQALEMTVITAKQQQTKLDMQHLQMLQDTWDKIKADPLAVSGIDLESLLLKKYAVRGRYGAAGFRREVL